MTTASILTACEHTSHGLFNFSSKPTGAWANYSEPTKTCSKCGVVKDVAGFSKSTRAKDGLHAHCRACDAARVASWRAQNPEQAVARAEASRKKHPEKIAARSAAWYAANKEKAAASHAAYALANREKIAARKSLRCSQNSENHYKKTAAWAKQNPEKIALYQAAWYEKNKKKASAAISAWTKANREAVRILGQNRRAMKKQAGGKLSKSITKLLLSEQGGKCAGCLGYLLTTGQHLDHVMPLSLGGANVDANIQLLCKTCNCKKGAKHPLDWMKQKGILTP